MSVFLGFSASAQEQTWQTIKPVECPFKVEAPALPAVRVDSVRIQGQLIRTAVYDVQHEWTMFSLSCSDYPFAHELNTREKAIELLKSSAARRVKGEPTELKEVEVSGYPGIEYVEHLGSAIIYHRAYVAGDKLYQLDVGDLQGTSREAAQRFFASFEVE